MNDWTVVAGGTLAKRAQLVSQHLENIAREALEKHQDIVRSYIRNRQGVYALYRKGRLYYVGLATNLRMRLKTHLRDRHGVRWDRFSVYLTIGDSHLRELESLVLRVVKPSGNKQIGKFKRSENLRSRFGRDVRAKQDVEFRRLLGEVRAAAVRAGASPSKKKDTGRAPVLARYAGQLTLLKGKHKGRIVKARVRADGSIRYEGTIYNSPSVAAARACRRRTCNGWTFWTFERAPGDWVQLAKLRQS